MQAVQCKLLHLPFSIRMPQTRYVELGLCEGKDNEELVATCPKTFKTVVTTTSCLLSFAHLCSCMTMIWSFIKACMTCIGTLANNLLSSASNVQVQHCLADGLHHSSHSGIVGPIYIVQIIISTNENDVCVGCICYPMVQAQIGLCLQIHHMCASMAVALYDNLLRCCLNQALSRNMCLQEARCSEWRITYKMAYS